MLQASEPIDVIIPRGGKSLVVRIGDKPKFPLLNIWTVFHIDIQFLSLILQQLLQTTIGARTSCYGTCNILETLLVYEQVAPMVLFQLAEEFSTKKLNLEDLTIL